MRLLPLNATSRVIAAHLALVALSTALVLGFVWFQTVGTIESEVRSRVVSEMRALAEEYRTRGLIGLSRTISGRVARPDVEATVYLLADRNGARIAGNLGDWPPTVRPGSGWIEIDLYRTDREAASPILAASVLLPDGQRLLVGHDRAARHAFDRTLGKALIWAVAVTLGLALVTGWLLSRLVLKRIDDIVTTAREIRAGDLGRRVPVRGSGDEFDRLAGELNHMLARIESLVTDLRMVTDSLAHDLRSPLTRLKARLEDAAAGAASARTEAAIAAAVAEGDRALGVCTALLDIARAEAGVGREQFDQLELGHLAHEAVELFAPAAEERGLSVSAASDGAVPALGHRQFLAQALTNLIENALQHAPPGSEVTVEARAEKGMACLAVADRGPGIAEDARSRVTRRFLQLDESRSAGGAGLGLALVQAVATLHGGRLKLLDNAPGLRAELRVPAVPAKADADRDPPPATDRVPEMRSGQADWTLHPQDA